MCTVHALPHSTRRVFHHGWKSVVDLYRSLGQQCNLQFGQPALREKLTAAEASVAQAEANVEKYRNAARHWKMQHDKLKAEASA